MLTETRGWAGAVYDDHPGIVGVETFLLGEDCMSFQLRQNPVNTCLIEQSADGGLSWLPAFDLSLCTSIVDGSSGPTTVSNFYNTAFNTFQENVYNNYVNNYISSITDIVPELGYGDGDDSFRDEALCYALSKFIDIVCEAGIEAFDALDETADDLKTALYLAVAISGIIALAATGVGTPAAIALAAQAALWASGIGAATSLGATLFDHFTGTNRSAYEDLQAREDVVCCLLAALESVNVDRDDFEAAFACTGLSTNAQAIHDAAAIFATEDATYAAFVENMRIGFNSAKLGLLPACGCGNGWAYEIDFTAGVGLWTVHLGTFVPGVGVKSATGATEGLQVYLTTTVGYVWSRIEAEYTRTSDGSFKDDFRVIVTNDVPTLADRYDWIEIGDPPPGGLVTHCASNPSPPARTNILVLIRDNNPGEEIVLKRIRVFNVGELSPPAPLIDNSTPRCT